MKVKEKVFINYKGEKYINGKKSATVLPKPDTHTFEEAVKYIDKTFNKYGLFSKCDRLVGLFKRGYDRLLVERELLRKIEVVPNIQLRNQIQDSYLRLVERVARQR